MQKNGKVRTKRKPNAGSFKSGNGGRPKGVPNKLTGTVKETVLKVFQDLQNTPRHNLTAFGKRYPRDFYNIAARLIPTEITGHFDKVKIEIVRNNNSITTGQSSQQPAEGSTGQEKV